MNVGYSLTRRGEDRKWRPDQLACINRLPATRLDTLKMAVRFLVLHRDRSIRLVAEGLGANTIVFGVANAVVLKPLPVSDPDRVVFVQRVGSFVSHSFPFYRDLRDRNVGFESLTGFRITMMEVDANQSATHEWGYLATGSYFDLLGVTPALGRFFGQAEDVAPGASP